MRTPDDRVALTIEEQRALVSLQERVRRDAPMLTRSLGTGWRYARLRSDRARASSEGICLVAGLALMLATFVEWPAVAVGGVGLQIIGLRALLIRWGPSAGTRLRGWIERRPQTEEVRP
jgi:hypothetical protein